MTDCTGGCGKRVMRGTLWRRLLPEERENYVAQGVSEHKGRGLCGSCWDRAKSSDVLVDFERVTRTTEDTVEDWLLLRSEGFGRRQAAERLGVPYKTLQKALERARRRGLLTRQETLAMEKQHAA